MRCATGPTSSATRSFISPAALLVNVIARISNGETLRSAIRYATRWVSRRVLPEPAPAMTSTGPSGAITASRWTGFRPATRSSPTRPNPVVRVPSVTGRIVQVFAPGRRAVTRQVVRRDPQLGGGDVVPSGAVPARHGRARVVPERPQEAGAVLVEGHGEGAAGLVELEREVLLPVRVERGRVGDPRRAATDEIASARCRTARCCGRTRCDPEPDRLPVRYLEKQSDGAVVDQLDLPYRPGKLPVSTGVPSSRSAAANPSISGSACSGSGGRAPTTGAGPSGCRRRA